MFYVTKRLYYNDLYQIEFDACVITKKERNGKFEIVLDQTLFYPGGGGQPCDLGRIGDQQVVDVYEKNGEIIHVLEQDPVAEDSRIHGTIDWEQRFELMQQHLGQHILSAVFVRDFSKNTVGLRMTRDEVSIDLDGFVSEQQIAQAEAAANEVVYKNDHIEILYPDIEEIRRCSKRPVPQKEEAIRIVKIADLDYAPCCGLHTGTTGEVGMIKVIKTDKQKYGSRIHFTCGRNALRRVGTVCRNSMQLQKKLNCQEDELIERVVRQQEEVQQLKQKLDLIMKRLAAAEAEKLIKKAPRTGEVILVAHTLMKTTLEEIRLLYAELTKIKGVAVLLGGKTSDGAVLMFGCNKAENRVDVREAFQQAINTIGGKGGGGACCAQGFSPDSTKLDEAVESAVQMLIVKEKEYALNSKQYKEMVL